MWNKIGEVAVDSGRIWIVDPAYVEDVVDSEDWDEGASPLVNGVDPKGEDIVLGAMVSTGAGDGLYDIMARHTPHGAVAEIRIEFLR